MARKRRVHKTSPKTPAPRQEAARASARTRTRSHHHPELIGLGLVALGVFLAAVLWFGFSGGPVGSGSPTDAVGAAAYLGAARARAARRADGDAERARRLPAVPARPRRRAGRSAADARERARRRRRRRARALVALGLGTTGATILGVLLRSPASLFLTGASLGALAAPLRARASARAPTRVPGARPERSTREPVATPSSVALAAGAARSTSKQDYPDLVSDSISAPPPPLLAATRTSSTTDEDTQETLFDAAERGRADYKLPDRALLRGRSRGAGPNAEATQRVAEALVTCLAHFGVEATVVGQISGPRVTRYELQLAPGTKVGEGRAAEGRPLATRSRRPRSASSRRSPASRRSASRCRT